MIRERKIVSMFSVVLMSAAFLSACGKITVPILLVMDPAATNTLTLSLPASMGGTVVSHLVGNVDTTVVVDTAKLLSTQGVPATVKVNSFAAAGTSIMLGSNLSDTLCTYIPTGSTAGGIAYLRPSIYKDVSFKLTIPTETKSLSKTVQALMPPIPLTLNIDAKVIMDLTGLMNLMLNGTGLNIHQKLNLTIPAGFPLLGGSAVVLDTTLKSTKTKVTDPKLDQCASTSKCGNGTVDAGETCDTAILAGKKGACPISCDDGNACTGDVMTGSPTTCNVVCTHTPIVCRALDQCHVAGVCNTTTGVCSNPNKTDGTVCNDGDACTQTDTCLAGLCVGSNPVVCPLTDQCHLAGVCDPSSGVCSNPNKTDGTGCNDGNACTQTDICQAGVCTGSNPVVCVASDQCHLAGTCSPSTGACSNPNKTDGTSCNDANACTQTDICQAGVCVGSNPVICKPIDQCHDAGVCDPVTSLCSIPAKSDGIACNDFNACTQTDTCQSGICTGSNPVVCSALDQCHAAGVCDPSSGNCSNPTVVDGIACSDGNACTQTDTCQSGVCTGANPVVCLAPDQCPTPGVCDPFTGICSNPTLADGTACPTLPTLKLKEVSVSTPVLESVTYGTYTGKDLNVLTLFSESDSKVGTFVDAAKGQIAFLETPDHQSVAVAYIPASDIASGITSVTLDKIADGFIMCNPLMMGYVTDDRESILSFAKSDPNYTLLKGAITNALSAEPQNMMNEAVFPEIYKYAIDLIIAGGKQFNIQNAAKLNVMAASMNPLVPVLGQDDRPYVGDVEGGDVVFVNPTMLFYGVEINNGQAFDLIAGKDQAWGLEWWAHGPVQEDYALGDGPCKIRYSKGQIGGSVADSMAAAANIAKSTQLILDLVAWCPISNETIADGVKAYVLNEVGLAALVSAFKDVITVSPEDVLNNTIQLLEDKDFWHAVSTFFYNAATNKELAIHYLQTAKTLIEAGDIVLKAYDVSTTTFPFCWDLITKPNEVDLCGNQTNGVLTADCRSLIPPKAVVSLSPNPAYVGEIVTFDASGSSDEYDTAANLYVRWDFDGDGTFDTDWSTAKQATHSYANVGVYTARLQVRDSDNMVSTMIVNVYVLPVGAQGLAHHIKVFRDGLPWKSNAFETVMASLGYTEGTGTNQYEILPSSAMANNIMVPSQDLVIIMNDQDQNFYNNIAASYDRIVRFLTNGGAMLWEACDLGWAGGSMATASLSLPKGVIYTAIYDTTNYNALPGSTLMSGLPSTLTGNYASHEYFTNLPAGAVVYIKDINNHATMFEYSPYGLGSVIVTGNPLEFNYDRISIYTMGLVYPRLFAYVLGDVNATVLAKANQIQAESLDMSLVDEGTSSISRK